jgi:hypothetical protein
MVATPEPPKGYYIMFADTLTCDYAGTGDLVLTKRKEDGYTSEYFGTISDRDFIATIKHTLPKSRVTGETSHMVRLDCIKYDAAGAIIEKSSSWRVFGTYLGRQDATNVANLNKTVGTIMTAGNLTKLLNGES